MPRNTLTSLAAAASLLAVGTARAQSLVGDEFAWDFIQPVFSPSPETATVGPGPEFSIIFLDREYEVDIDATSITVTAMPRPPGTSFDDTWGSNGNELLSQLQITGLNFDDGGIIQGVSVSGTAGSLDQGDVEFTANSIFIGASVPSNNRINWSEGQSITVDLDVCPGPAVLNVDTGDTFQTIQDAISASSKGDTLLLGPCTFFERGIIIDDRDLTIIGAGRDLTVIDGELEDGSILRFRGADKSTIESLTLRNGVANSSSGGGAVFTSQTRHDVVFRDVHFHGNRGGGELYGAVYIAGGDFHFEDCLFSENRGDAASAIGVGTGVRARVTAVNTVFADNTNANGHVWLQSGLARLDADFVNCTFGRTPGTRHILASSSDTTVNAINCVFQGNKTPIARLSGPTTSLSRCVVPNPQGDNIQGPPVFVDAANLDYRLAAGSPGIDAADASAYAAFGGSPLDAAWGARTNNDAGVADTGIGPFAFLDAGAYEFQGNSPRLMDADFNMDGSVDFFDLLDLLALIDAFMG